jgi:HD-GYP domain-containing protein (c-di-GMP phosphodiesterase class II)
MVDGDGDTPEPGQAAWAGQGPEAGPMLEMKGRNFQILVDGFRQVKWPAVLTSVEALARDYEELLVAYQRLGRQHEELRDAHERLRRDRDAPQALFPGPEATPAPPGRPADDERRRETPVSQDPVSPPLDLVDELARRRAGARGLFWVGRLALQDRDGGIFVETVLDYITETLGSDTAFLILRDDEGHFTESHRGEPALVHELVRRLPAAFDELVKAGGSETRSLIGPERESTARAALIPGPGQARGVLGVGRAARRGAFQADEEEFFLAYAQTIALALDRLLLRQHVESDLLDAIMVFVTALESKDPDLNGHSARVSLYAGELATTLGLPPAQVAVARRVGLLHDLGKLMMLDTIRLKPSGLNEEEYARIRRYPLLSAKILRPLRFLTQETAAVRHHRERYDGTGYPDGRQGDTIPLPARVVGVADAFDAMTSPRPYREALSLDAALEDIQRNAGSQFDPAVVNALLSTSMSRLSAISQSYRSRTEPLATVRDHPDDARAR